MLSKNLNKRKEIHYVEDFCFSSSFSVTSSENSDKEQRYRDFQLLILPYPG